MAEKDTLCLRPIATDSGSLRALFRLLDIDFPPGARIPLVLLRASLKKGRLKGVYLKAGGKVYGYALYQWHTNPRFVHVSYLAILPPYRGRGLGGVLMDKLGALAGGRILLDAEDPARMEDPKERSTAARRIAFYRRNGYRVYPYFKFVNFGYHMRVLASWPLPRYNWLKIYRRLHNGAYGLPISGVLIKLYR